LFFIPRKKKTEMIRESKKNIVNVSDKIKAKTIIYSSSIFLLKVSSNIKRVKMGLNKSVSVRNTTKITIQVNANF
jgi:hypothetical protein